MAVEHEDAREAQPEDSIYWWNLDEKSACDQVSSAWAAASMNIHLFQGTAQATGTGRQE